MEANDNQKSRGEGGRKETRDHLEEEFLIGVHLKPIQNTAFRSIYVFWRERAHSPHQFLKGVYDPSPTVASELLI